MTEPQKNQGGRRTSTPPGTDPAAIGRLLRVEKGDFDFVDVYKARMKGTRRLVCELTLRYGLVVYELNGLSRESWDRLGKYGSQGDPRLDGTHEDSKPKR